MSDEIEEITASEILALSIIIVAGTLILAIFLF